jgi:hypothetical protein
MLKVWDGDEKDLGKVGRIGGVSWAKTLELDLFISHMTLNNSHNLSVPQFSHL